MSATRRLPGPPAFERPRSRLAGAGSTPVPPPANQSITWTATTSGTGTFTRSNGDRDLRISGSVSNPYCVSTTFTVDDTPRYVEMLISATTYGTDARYFQVGVDTASGPTADTSLGNTYGWYYNGAAATDSQELCRHAAGAIGGYAGAALPVRLGIGLRQTAAEITLWQNGALQYTVTGGSIATHLAGSLKLRAGLNVTATRDAYFQILTSAAALYLPAGYGYV